MENEHLKTFCLKKVGKSTLLGLLVHPPQIRLFHSVFVNDFKVVTKQATEEECRVEICMTPCCSCTSWMHCQPKDEPKRQFDERVILYSCADFGKPPENTSDLTVKNDISKILMNDCMWASFSISAEYEQYKSLAMNQELSHTQVLVEAVKIGIQDLVDLDMRAAISVATSQDWKTFRWLRLTLINDPLGDMICTRIREFSDSVLCVGRHNFSPSANWPEKFAQV